MSMFMTFMILLSLVSLPVFSFAVFLFLNQTMFMIEFNILHFSSINLSFEVMLDWISSMYMAIVLFISSMILMYSSDYSSKDQYQTRFILLLLLFVLSMILSVCSSSLISILLGWDGLGLTSYLLVAYYQNKESYMASMITVLSNRVGDSAILISIAWMYTSGSWNYWSYELCNPNFTSISILLIIAAMTKSAQIPFSAWLPEASAAPTPISSLVHSSTLVTAGVFLMIRFNFLFQDSNNALLLSLVSLATILLPSINALTEKDLKKIIAMSTMSQLGLSMLNLSLGAWFLSFLHSITHALFKALMFLSAGSILHAMAGNQDLRFMGKKINSSVLSNQAMFISILCLTGFPFLSGFFSKDLISNNFFMSQNSFLIYLLFLLSVILSALYSFQMFSKFSTYIQMDSPYSNFHENKKMSSAIVSSSLFSIVSGGMILWLLNFYLLPITLSMEKMLTGFCIFFLLGLVVILLFGYNFYYSATIKYYKLNSFNTLSFLSTITGSMWLGLFSKASLYSDQDQTWMENFSGQASFNFLLSFSQNYSKIQSSEIFMITATFLALMFLVFM